MDGGFTPRSNTALVPMVEHWEKLIEVENDCKEVVKAAQEQLKVARGAIKAHKRAMVAIGHDVEAAAQIIRERCMEPVQRVSYQATLQIYRARFGMLDGTPLGEHARKELFKRQQPKPPEDKPRDDDDGDGANVNGELRSDIADRTPFDDPRDEALSRTAAGPTPEQIEEARAEGGSAARAGRQIFENQHPAGDPRRAAWDEGWCREKDSDGMDIPEHLQRKPKNGKGKGDGGASSGDAGAAGSSKEAGA